MPWEGTVSYITLGEAKSKCTMKAVLQDFPHHVDLKRFREMSVDKLHELYA